MSKVRGDNQEIAADFMTYADDSMVADVTASEAWRAVRRVGSVWQYVRLQDAVRKRTMTWKEGVL